MYEAWSPVSFKQSYIANQTMIVTLSAGNKCPIDWSIKETVSKSQDSGQIISAVSLHKKPQKRVTIK